MKAILSILFVCLGLQARADVLAGPVMNPVNGHTYYLLTQNTWSNAQAEAVALGGNLATIRNPQEQDWIFDTFSGYGGPLWIGLTDRAEEGAFEWISGEPVDYTNWEEAQPDNGTGGIEHYVHIWPPGDRSPGRWNDYGNFADLFGVPFYAVMEISAPGRRLVSVNQLATSGGFAMDVEELILQGDAQFVENRLQLTPSDVGKGGGAWRSVKQSVRDGFSTVFQIQITERVRFGADGLAFVIQNGPGPALGYAGCNLGFGGMTNQFVIKFDTYHWRNDAPASFDEVAVLAGNAPGAPLWDNGNVTPLASVTNGVVFSDGAVHTVKIVYVPGNLQLYLDDMENPLMTVYVNIAKLVDLDDGRAWVGFTAATGADCEKHEVLNWSYAANDFVSRLGRMMDELDSRNSVTSSQPPVFAADVVSEPIALPWDNAFGRGLPPGIGLTHEIEVSSDLVNWAPASNVMFFFRDLDSTHHDARYYRFVPK